MKYISHTLLLSLATLLLALAACQDGNDFGEGYKIKNEDESKPEDAITVSMTGQWYCTIDAVDDNGTPIHVPQYDMAGNLMGYNNGDDYFGVGQTLILTYNTAGNSANEMWIDNQGIGNFAAAYAFYWDQYGFSYPTYAIKAKVTIDQNALTFRSTDSENIGEGYEWWKEKVKLDEKGDTVWADEDKTKPEMEEYLDHEEKAMPVTIEGKILKGAGHLSYGMSADSIIFFVTYKGDPWYPDDGYTRYKVSGVRFSGGKELELKLYGESRVVINKGTPYEEPGFVATLDGKDISSQVKIDSDVNTAKTGFYTVTYTAVNLYGETMSISRRVAVIDPENAIDGLYYVQADSYRRNKNGEIVKYGSIYSIFIVDNGDNTCSVDDILGGWYCQRAGYGDSYTLTGTLRIADDGSVSCIKSFINGWGYSHDDFEGTFDAATGIFRVKTVFAGMEFVQTWIKKSY